MLELEEAQHRILSRIKPLPSETVSLGRSCGRTLAEDIPAPLDLPPFDNSAMDGYALRAADTTGACAERPVSLSVIGTTPAGTAFGGEVTAGTCVRLFTGSPMPKGADAVVMQEDTRLDLATADRVWLLDSAKPWENVRFRGEDVKQTQVLASAGECLTPGRIALLAAVGRGDVLVGRRPSVGLIATGSELREPGQPLEPGEIYESNRASLAALVSQAGGIPKIFPLARDHLEVIRSLVDQALSECDVVITSGGVSVGEWDLVKKALEGAGGELEYWGVAIKPGKPFVFGARQGKLLFGLPGNPVSAFVTFLLLARAALLKLQGAKSWQLASHPGVLGEPIANRGERRHFVRVIVEGNGEVRSAGLQGSHILRSLAQADGLIDVPSGSSWRAGEKVTVLRWG